MLVVDRLLVGGIKFVLSKLAAAVEAEIDDDSAVREELLAAQMKLELGEIDDAEYRAVEAVLLARLREIQERRRGDQPAEAAVLRDGTFEVEVATDWQPLSGGERGRRG